LTLQATAQTAYGAEADSPPVALTVVPTRAIALAGQVLDPAGRPAAGAAVTWRADGLAAEFYQFNHQLSQIPDLSGLQPARTAYISALNYPNPQQIFGNDPLGAGLGQNYAVRFHGSLAIATAGEYRFQVNAQSGARLSIDGAEITDSNVGGAAATLSAGPHELEVVAYASGDGASVQLLWMPPGGALQIVPPAALSVVSPAAITADGGRFQLLVPAILNGVQVVPANSAGVVRVDR
jgi:hypothetical protein